jgi:preprotein translocase subunit SecA
MVSRIKDETVTTLLRLQLARQEDVEELAQPEEVPLSFSGGEEAQARPAQRQAKKVGRNDPCPCGSGKKYKKCCGR